MKLFLFNVSEDYGDGAVRVIAKSEERAFELMKLSYGEWREISLLETWPIRCKAESVLELASYRE